jgi:hypothetical protein
MKKVLLMLLMGLMALGASVKVYASARVDSLGTDIREVEDLDLIWLYPNKVVDYKNTVDFRLNTGGTGGWGNGTGEWGGVIAEESSLGGVVGVYVNRPTYVFNTSAHPILANLGGFLNPLRYNSAQVGGYDYRTAGYESTNIVDVFWGQGIGGANLGVHLNYGDNGVGTSPNPPEEANVSLALGLGFTGAGPFDELNIHADYAMQSITDLNNNTNKNKDNGINDIKIGALGQMNVSTDNFVKVFADATVDQYNVKDLLSWGTSDTTLVLGTSCSHKVNGGKGLVVTGLLFDWVGAQYTKYETSPTPNDITNGNSWSLVWNGSVESELASWLTGRFGIEKAIVNRQYISTHNPTYFAPNTNANENLSFNGGFGINWQNFTLDGQVSMASLENSIANVQPGNGLLFTNSSNIVTVTEADLRYKF